MKTEWNRSEQRKQRIPPLLKTQITDQINSGTVTQSKTNTGLEEDDDLTDLEKQIQDHAIKKAIQRYDAIQALESATDTRFSVTHGDSSKELIDNISDIKYSEKGKLIALKFKGEDVKLTVKGEINKLATVQNKDILRAIEKAKAKYNKSIASVVNMIQEEAQRNDFTRFERFKKWAKENIAGVSAVAVIAGRSAVKKGAKAVGQFGKALANDAKKAAPAIARILNILA